MSRRLILALTGLLAIGAAPVRADPPPSPPPAAPASPAKPSMQEIYNQAQAAYDKGDLKTAIAGFETVLGPDNSAKPSHSKALIRTRLAVAYLDENRLAEARRSALIAITGLSPADGPDLAEALIVLGDAERFDQNMEAAIAAYDRALGLAMGPEGQALADSALIDKALAAMVVDPARSAAALDVILNAPKTMAGLSKDASAQILDLRGRAELNLGNPKAAVKFFTKAIDMTGGLTSTKVSLAQVSMRSDLAIAYQLLHDDENTHRAMAFSGAGHLKSEAWGEGSSMEPPACDDRRDLKPDDTAVVEFAINGSGRVVGAAPIYASRPGRMGVEFARAVRQWTWTPETLAQLNPFWRSAIRVQIGCDQRPKPDELSDEFEAAATRWLVAKGVDQARFTALVNGPVKADDPRLSDDDVLAIAVIFHRMQTPGEGLDDPRLDHRMDEALNAAAAPPEIRALILERRAKRSEGDVGGFKYRRLAARLGVDAPQFERTWPGTRSAAWLRLEYALALENAGRFADARPQLDGVLAYPPTAVPADDPIRKVAVLHIATLERRRGDSKAAEASISQAGLSPGQCSLMDVRPVVRNNSISDDAFPNQALIWNFEGFVRVGYDIDATGRPTNVRTLLAYPPFIFDKATEKAVSGFSYLPPTINGQAVGCTGHVQGVVYNVPQSR